MYYFSYASFPNIAYESENVFEEKIEHNEEYDPDQGERILNKYITEDLVNKYFAMFWGRTDVYAKRGAKGGYFPQCNNRLAPLSPGQALSAILPYTPLYLRLSIFAYDLTGYPTDPDKHYLQYLKIVQSHGRKERIL